MISTKQTKKENVGKSLPKAGLLHSIIAITFIVTLMMFSHESTSRPSTASEIAEQIRFQEKWNTAQKEAEQKWNSIIKENHKEEQIGK